MRWENGLKKMIEIYVKRGPFLVIFFIKFSGINVGKKWFNFESKNDQKMRVLRILSKMD